MRGAERGRDVRRQRAPPFQGSEFGDAAAPASFAARPCSSSTFSAAQRGARASLPQGALGQHQSQYEAEPSYGGALEPAAGCASTPASTSYAPSVSQSMQPTSRHHWAMATTSRSHAVGTSPARVTEAARASHLPLHQTSFIPIRHSGSGGFRQSGGAAAERGDPAPLARSPPSMMGLQNRGVVRKRRTLSDGKQQLAHGKPGAESSSAMLDPISTSSHDTNPRQQKRVAVRFDSVQDPFVASSSSNTVATVHLSSSSSNSKSRKPASSLDYELVSKLKRSRISQTPGQLRLEAGVKECRKRFKSGYVNVYMERHNPDVVNIVIKRAFPQSTQLVELRFIARAPKFYPHEPLAITLTGDLPEFAMSESLVVDRDSRSVMFDMLRKGTWSCVLSLYDVAINLACLVYEPVFQQPRMLNETDMDVDMGEHNDRGDGVGGSMDTTERFKKENAARYQHIVAMLPPLAQHHRWPLVDGNLVNQNNDA
eukprot:g3455.t1